MNCWDSRSAVHVVMLKWQLLLHSLYLFYIPLSYLLIGYFIYKDRETKSSLVSNSLISHSSLRRYSLEAFFIQVASSLKITTLKGSLFSNLIPLIALTGIVSSCQAGFCLYSKFFLRTALYCTRLYELILFTVFCVVFIRVLSY